MSDPTYVVKGEASESEPEEQEEESSIPNLMVVDGEASESDDDIVSYTNLSPIRIELTTNDVSPIRRPPVLHNSILQNKLCDQNLSLWNHLNVFIQTTFMSASKQLIATDQLQLHSQVSLQSASRSIKSLNDLSKQLVDKSTFILTSNFLPHMRNVNK